MASSLEKDMPPTILVQSLESVRRRVRLLGLVFGIGIVLSTVIALLIATVLVDYLFDLPSIPRLLLILAAMAGTGYVLWHWVIRPVTARLSLGDIAGRLEQSFPQFQDRLRSTVNIITGNVPGSEMMKQRIVTEATDLAKSIDLNRAIVLKPVWYSTAAGFGSILLVIVLLLTISSQYTQIALERLLLPFGGTQWPKTVQIDLVGAIPQRVAVGQRLDVNVRLARGDRASRKATIFYQYGDESGQHFGAVEQEYMTRDDDGVYHASLDARIGNDMGATAAAGAMKIWIKSGDDQLNALPVKVVQRLATQSVTATITPPPYAKLPAITVNLSQNPAVLTIGSQVVITAAFNKPLASAAAPVVESLTPNVKSTIQWDAPQGSVVVGHLNAVASIRFHLHAKDIDGFENTAVEEYELIVRPDQNPTVLIENPRRNEDRTPVAVVPLQAVAEDDFGIKSLKLEVDRLGDKKHWEIPLVESAQAIAGTTWNRIDGAGDLQRFRANYGWDLAALKDAQLKPGDVLEYYALVTDNYELNGETHAPVPSGRLRINIISQEEFANKITDELRAIAEQIAQVKANQGRTQRETANLANDTKDHPKFDAADKVAADRLANQQSTAASQAKQLSGKLDDIQIRMDENKSPNTELKETAKDVGNLLNATAEQPMKSAAADINAAKLSDKPDDRNQKLTDAQNQQTQSTEQLQKALDRMGNIGSLSRMIDQIKTLLSDQQKISADTQAIGKNNLGKKPEEMSADDKNKLDKNAKDQADLADRTAKALDEMAKTADKLSQSDPSSSQAMKDAAQTGQQQNVPGQQQKASQAAQQNQQSQAQSAQKQAELGLQMILNSLREAERRKLEELAKKLEEMQKQIANLIRRQAGHNIDNLVLQGGDHLAKLDAKEKQALFDKAERDPKEQPALIELAVLSGGQEQTERNTRDIAKTAEDLPDGAEPADRLTEAADKMERAIVSLRDNKLADAYDPPQVAALAALEAAKKLIDQQKAAVDQKQQDQQKEAIRQVYVQIREAQQKLNVETTRIDSAPRLDDGSLHRDDAIRLGQLPGEQGKLADRAAKLDEDLSALGSIVYIWANKDIVTTMKQVKDDLGKPQTGVSTQAEQKRVLSELDAMIRDLAVKPLESKFAQESNGGGGGQCVPGLPSEAELRLLKDLQVAINDSTKTIDADPNKDKATLLSLGGRQGEMRNLLDQLLQKASQGQMKLGAEPDNRDQLPEEADQEQIENQELDKNLLNDQPGAQVVQKDMNLVGDRMARSRQRLAINDDPGKITQAIQERILSNLDDLIEMARQKQAQTQGQPKSGSPQQASAPKPNSGVKPGNQANSGVKNQGGSTPAQNSNNGGPGAQQADVSSDIHQKMTEWGGITPRQRQAVIEGAGEQVLDKYKTLVDDYYRSLATKTNGQ
jgi:hypothetical protein